MSDAAEMMTLGGLQAGPVAQENHVEISGGTQQPGLHELHSSCQRGDRAKVAQFLEEGVDVHSTAEDGATALHWAAASNQMSICEMLLAAGADPNYRGGFMNATPFQWACRNGLVYIAHLLLQHGADPTQADEQGYTGLHLAVHSSNVLLVIYLIHLEIPIDVVDEDQRTPLHWAAYQGDHLSVGSMLKCGASPHAKDAQGFTPLHWALVNRSQDSVTQLLKYGADPNVVNASNKTCFDVASEMDSKNELHRGFEDSGRDANGLVRPKVLSPLATKLIVFAAPSLVLPWIIWLLGNFPMLIALPLAVASVLGVHKILKRYVYYNVWPGKIGVMQSPLLAGIYNGFFVWICIFYLFIIMPVTFKTSIWLNLSFMLLASSVVVFYAPTVLMDPGLVRPGSVKCILESIKDLLDAGDYDAEHFCATTFVRKPARAEYSRYVDNVVARFDHYCPWAYNAIGVRNHRAFLAYLCCLSGGLFVGGILVYRYLRILTPDLRQSIGQAPCLAVLFCLTAFQASWIFFLTGVQLAQVARALTSQEVINRAKGTHSEPSFGSLPLDHPSTRAYVDRAKNTPTDQASANPASGPRTPHHHHHHHHGKGWRLCLNLLGVRQVILTTRIMFNRGGNPADHGVWRNCTDFWFSGGDILKPDGASSLLDGREVDYYTLWDMPNAKNYHYQHRSRAGDALRGIA